MDPIRFLQALYSLAPDSQTARYQLWLRVAVIWSALRHVPSRIVLPPALTMRLAIPARY